MRYKWLNKEGNNKLILFFNGWGMDENVVKHLDVEDYDILMFYDYNTLDTDFNWELLNIYHEKNLIAWSMGVMIDSIISTLIRPLGTFSHQWRRVCINGTLKPIDEEFGIHPKIYDLTIKGFSEKSRDRFIKSMFDTQPPFAFQAPSPLERDLKNQHSELITLKEICKLAPSLTLPLGEGKSLYNKILISDNDKIIPTKSQVAFWGIEPNLKSGHCPFFQFKKWSELL